MKRLLLPAIVLAAMLAGYMGFAPRSASADDVSSYQDIHALNLLFDRTSMTVPAGADVHITLYNDENFVAHNLTVTDPDGNTVPGAETTKACLGQCVSHLDFAAPAPGLYRFKCTLHDTVMFGDLWVQ